MFKTKRSSSSDEEFEPEDDAVDPERETFSAWDYADLVNEVAMNGPHAQEIKTVLGVDDLLTIEGMTAWLTRMKGISAGSWADDVLAATEALPLSVREMAGVALADIFGIENGSWNEVLAAAMVDRLGTYDTTTNDAVIEMIEATGGDMEEFERALGRRALFGSPSAPFTAPERGTDAKIVAATRNQISELIKRERRDTLQTVKDRRALPADLKRQRALDRVAWVLVNLKTTRECVAVAVSKLEDVHLFANNPDVDMSADFLRLITAANGDAADVLQQTSTLYDELVAGGLEVRTGAIKPEQYAKAERRLKKTVAFLSQMEREWKNLQVTAHVGDYEALPGETKVHAETRAADTAYRRRKEELRAAKMDGGLSEMEQKANTEAVKRRIREAEIAIGISKLCCFHCWRMLRTMNADGIPLTASGTHFKTYAWPAPEALTDPGVLAAFLGLDAGAPNLSKDERLLLEAIKTPKGRKAIITGITTSAGTGGDQVTGYDSSGDEADDAPELSLWKAKVPPGTQLKPAVKKAPVKKAPPRQEPKPVLKRERKEEVTEDERKKQKVETPEPYVDPKAEGVGLRTRSRSQQKKK